MYISFHFHHLLICTVWTQPIHFFEVNTNLLAKPHCQGIHLEICLNDVVLCWRQVGTVWHERVWETAHFADGWLCRPHTVVMCVLPYCMFRDIFHHVDKLSFWYLINELSAAIVLCIGPQTIDRMMFSYTKFFFERHVKLPDFHLIFANQTQAFSLSW